MQWGKGRCGPSLAWGVAVGAPATPPFVLQVSSWPGHSPAGPSQPRTDHGSVRILILSPPPDATGILLERNRRRCGESTRTHGGRGRSRWVRRPPPAPGRRAEFSVSPSLCLSLPPIPSDSPPHDYASFFKTPFHFRSFKSRSHSRPVLYVVLNPIASCVTFSVSILQFGVSVEASAGRRDWLPLWPLAIPGPRLLPHPRRG